MIGMGGSGIAKVTFHNMISSQSTSELKQNYRFKKSVLFNLRLGLCSALFSVTN